MSVVVTKITDVSLHLYSTSVLMVGAQSAVPVPGFLNGQLVPWAYVHQPDDGIQDFTMIADPPSPQVPRVQDDGKVNAVLNVPTMEWMKGVRVHSATNHIEALVSGAERHPEVGLWGEDRLPWPW